MATNTPNTVSFGNVAQTMIAPDLMAQQLQLARQQQLADYLRQQALSPIEQQTVTGAGPSRVVPISPVQGLAKMLQAYIGGKSQDAIDQKTLGMGRDMAQRYAQILGGGQPQEQQPDQSPPIDPNASAALAQGAQVGSIGPTMANAQSMNAMPPAPPQMPPQQQAPAMQGAPAPGSNAFGLANLLRGSMVEQVGGAPAATAYWDQSKLTDASRMALAAHLDPVKANADALTKATYIAPTNVRGFGIATPNGLQALPMNAPPGFMPKQNPDGGWSYAQVGNGPEAVAASANAQAGGKAAGAAPYEGPVAVPLSDGRTLTLSKPEYAAYQATGALPSRYSSSQGIAPQAVGDPNATVTPAQRAAGDVASLQREIVSVSRSMDAPAVKQNRLDILNAELVKASAAAGGVQGTLSQAAPEPATTPVVGMSPPLGTTPNADASQKASADSMKDSYMRLQSVGTTANAALDALTKMQGLAAKKNALLTAGPLGTNQAAINPDAAEYEKQRANVVALMAQQLGASGTDAGRANISESVPDFGKPKAAIADGLGTLQNQIVAQQMKRNFLAPVYQAGDSKKYTTLENQFDQHVAPSVVPLLTMQAGPQRAAALSVAAKDPAMRARLNWAAENGLLK